MMTKQVYKKVSGKEMAKSFVLPVKQTPQQRRSADEQLKNARKLLRKKSTEKDVLASELLQLRFQIEDYLENKEFNASHRFGDFLKTYLVILKKKRNEFAKDISVHETLVSQWINNRRIPNESIMIRLEIHSNQNIPAEYWLRVVEKEKKTLYKN